MTETDVREIVRKRADKLGGVRALAREMGVQPSYVSDFLNGRRGVGPAFRKHFGIKVETIYVFTLTGKRSDDR